jgi:AAA15 family ATPase/GTPase
VLIEFSVANYRSFQTETVLSMVASKKKSRERELDLQATFEVEQLGTRLLKCAAIYGANGAGKSNLFKALGFMKEFVSRSANADDIDAEIDTTSFALNVSSTSEPSKFKVIFLVAETTYEYGFSVNRSNVVDEWLLSKPKGALRSSELFLRNGDTFKIHKEFKEADG